MNKLFAELCKVWFVALHAQQSYEPLQYITTNTEVLFRFHLTQTSFTELFTVKFLLVSFWYSKPVFFFFFSLPPLFKANSSVTYTKKSFTYLCEFEDLTFEKLLDILFALAFFINNTRHTDLRKSAYNIHQLTYSKDYGTWRFNTTVTKNLHLK